MPAAFRRMSGDVNSMGSDLHGVSELVAMLSLQSTIVGRLMRLDAFVEGCCSHGYPFNDLYLSTWYCVSILHSRQSSLPQL